MLRATERVILHYDLVMKPYPEDGPAIPLKELLPHLAKRVAAGESFQEIDNKKRVIRLADLKYVQIAPNRKAAALLFSLGDLDKADPGFTELATGKVRIARPEKGEAGGLSVHAVVGMDPIKGDTYRMTFEDVGGFGRTPIQSFLRHEFKVICDEAGFTFTRPGGSDVKVRPLVEIYGCQSEKLKNSLREGRLLHVQLVDHVETNFGFDEQRFVTRVRKDLSLSVARTLPSNQALSFLGKLKAFASKNGYERMNVRWKEDGQSKPQSAQLDTSRADAGEALFVRSDEISLRAALPEISAKICDELVGKMTTLLE